MLGEGRASISKSNLMSTLNVQTPMVALGAQNERLTGDNASHVEQPHRPGRSGGELDV